MWCGIFAEAAAEVASLTLRLRRYAAEYSFVRLLGPRMLRKFFFKDVSGISQRTLVRGCGAGTVGGHSRGRAADPAHLMCDADLSRDPVRVCELHLVHHRARDALRREGLSYARHFVSGSPRTCHLPRPRGVHLSVGTLTHFTRSVVRFFTK